MQDWSEDTLFLFSLFVVLPIPLSLGSSMVDSVPVHLSPLVREQKLNMLFVHSRDSSPFRQSIVH